MRTYFIFEGGGAKGYAHVGALKAIEREIDAARCVPRGYAGTSAGAIIATLASVGWTSSELIDPDRQTHLVQHLYGDDYRPFNLLGIGKNRIVRVAQGRQIWQYTPKRDNWANTVMRKLRDADKKLSAITAFLVMGRTGLSTTDAARRAIEKAIAQKTKGDGRQTFAALFAETGLHLRIIAANVTRRALMVFSAQETPDVVVSEAVAASIAIPGVFEPVRIDVPTLSGQGVETCSFADGGLVSNLPAWVFDSERAIDREAVTILSEITDKPDRVPMFRLRDMIEPLVRTAVFGASRLNVRSIGRHLLFSIDSDRDLLDFEPSWVALSQELEKAHDIARQTIVDDTLLRDWIEEIRKFVHSYLSALEPDEISGGRVRAALATSATAEPYVPEYADDVIQLRYCMEYENDPDFRQVLSYSRSILGGAMRADTQLRQERGEAEVPVSNVFFIERTGLQLEGSLFEDPQDKRRVSQIPPDLKWWIIIPIRSLNATFPYTNMTLCIDGTHEISDESEAKALLQSVENYVTNSLPSSITGRRRES